MPSCQQGGCGRAALDGKQYCLDHHKDQERYNYGLDYEIQKKFEAKYDPGKERAVINWISQVTHKSFSGDLQSGLKSGVLLCETINAIWPGTIQKINTGNLPFPQRENIVAYLNACKAKGMKEVDLFVTEDLFEGKNIVAVIDNILQLGHIASNKGFRGAQLVTSGGGIATSSGVISAKATSPPQDYRSAGASVKSPSSPGGGGGSSRFCGGCGGKREGDAKFCGGCGGKF